MRCRADGRLQHHFWGEYRASMVLLFDSPLMLDATLATGKFKNWKRSEKKPETVIHWFGSSDELDVEVDELVTHGAKREKIASIAKSIDYGEPFEIELEAVDPRQTSLF
jgi:uncharacterized protein YbbC (DUF1343 family)